MGKKIFVGRLPQEANTDDLRHYFGRFGRILDAYIPKVRLRLPLFACHNILVVSTFPIPAQDPKRSGHRGFGFVTFADEGVAERVARRSHEILGHEVRLLVFATSVSTVKK